MPVKYRNRVKDNKRLHGIYHGVKKRCYNKNCKRYKDYAECKICGKKFLKNSTKQIYCGEKCRSISKRTSYRKTGMVVDWRRNKAEVV